MMGDLSGWVEDRVKKKITVAFGVPGESENGRKVVRVLCRKELCICNTYFKHKKVHNWSGVARG